MKRYAMTKRKGKYSKYPDHISNRPQQPFKNPLGNAGSGILCAIFGVAAFVAKYKTQFGADTGIFLPFLGCALFAGAYYFFSSPKST